jgi:hypothetical protein
MDLKINNIAFDGRAECAYGLKRAAIEAERLEKLKSSMRDPRPVNKETDIAAATASLNAYMDMVVHDNSVANSFASFIDDYKMISTLKARLATVNYTNGKLNPFVPFAEALRQKSSYNSKLQDVVDSLLFKLEY